VGPSVLNTPCYEQDGPASQPLAYHPHTDCWVSWTQLVTYHESSGLCNTVRHGIYVSLRLNPVLLKASAGEGWACRTPATAVPWARSLGLVLCLSTGESVRLSSRTASTASQQTIMACAANGATMQACRQDTYTYRCICNHLILPQDTSYRELRQKDQSGADTRQAVLKAWSLTGSTKVAGLIMYCSLVVATTTTKLGQGHA
jgi:hypothetical protein